MHTEPTTTERLQWLLNEAQAIVDADDLVERVELKLRPGLIVLTDTLDLPPNVAL